MHIAAYWRVACAALLKTYRLYTEAQPQYNPKETKRTFGIADTERPFSLPSIQLRYRYAKWKIRNKNLKAFSLRLSKEVSERFCND